MLTSYLLFFFAGLGVFNGGKTGVRVGFRNRRTALSTGGEAVIPDIRVFGKCCSPYSFSLSFY